MWIKSERVKKSRKAIVDENENFDDYLKVSFIYIFNNTNNINYY